MNRKQLGLLLALLLVVGGLGLLAYLRHSTSWQAGSSAGKILRTFDINAVDRVVLQQKNERVTLLRKDDRWQVENRDYPADFAKIKRTLQELFLLKPVQKVRVGSSQLPELHLTPPPEGDGLLVEFFTGENTVGSLLLGKVHLKKSDLFPGDEGFPSGRYILPHPAGQKPDVSLVKETLQELHTDPSRWIEAELISGGDLQEIAYEGKDPAYRWKLRRLDNGQWTFDDEGPGQIDPAKVPAFHAILGTPRLVDVQPKNATLSDPVATVIATNRDGITYTLTFGEAKEGRIPTTLKISATLPESRPPGENESDEEKQQQDETFAQKQKRLTAQLQREKTRENRVVELAASSFESIHRRREELLKADPPSEATPPTPLAPKAGNP